eukprot:750772-Hanusia_phi.AAC.2
MDPTILFLCLLICYQASFQVLCNLALDRQSRLLVDDGKFFMPLRGGKSFESSTLQRFRGNLEMANLARPFTLPSNFKARSSHSNPPKTDDKRILCDICTNHEASLGKPGAAKDCSWTIRVCRGCSRQHNIRDLLPLRGRCSDCSRFAVFGRDGKVKKRCMKHRRSEADISLNSRCSFLEGCHRQPSYWNPEHKEMKFCKSHRLDGHLCMKNRRPPAPPL